MRWNGHFGQLMLVILLTLAAATPARAQSDRELRRENEQLRTDIQRMERELDDAQREIAELRAANARLERALRNAGTPAGTGTPSAGGLVSVDESKPNASPRALLAAMIASYKEEAAGWDENTPQDLTLRHLERWSRGIERDLRKPVTWTVTPDATRDPVRVREGYEIMLIAIDPVHRTPLGDPFPAVVKEPLWRRLGAIEKRHGLDTLVLKGTSMPRVIINPARTEASAFDSPRFIGPYAEFGLTVNVQSMALPATEGESKRPGATSTPKK